MAGKSVSIRVPAAVGSVAGAMNCAALALDASLNVTVTPRFDGRVSVRYFGDHGERVPRDRSSLVVQAFEGALRFKGIEFAGADFEIYSSVPVAVGLGSSTAAVWAGLLAADKLFRLQLLEKNLFDLASIYESRRDSLRAAWLGGFVACGEENSPTAYRRVMVPENFVLSVVVPETSPVPGVQNANDRGCEDQAAYFTRARALAEFFADSGSGQSAEFNPLLPLRCEKVVPGLAEALQVRAPGLLAAFVCGSGPAVGILAQGDPSAAVRAVQECFGRQGVASILAEFQLTNAGAREWNAVPSEIALPRAPGLGPPAKKISLIPV